MVRFWASVHNDNIQNKSVPRKVRCELRNRIFMDDMILIYSYIYNVRGYDWLETTVFSLPLLYAPY